MEQADIKLQCLPEGLICLVLCCFSWPLVSRCSSSKASGGCHLTLSSWLSMLFTFDSWEGCFTSESKGHYWNKIYFKRNVPLKLFMEKIGTGVWAWHASLKGWGDGSAAKSAYHSHRGPGFKSQQQHQLPQLQFQRIQHRQPHTRDACT